MAVRQEVFPQLTQAQVQAKIRQWRAAAVPGQPGVYSAKGAGVEVTIVVTQLPRGYARMVLTTKACAC